MKRAGVISGLILSALLLSTTASGQTAQEVAGARAAATAGKQAFDDGEFEKAYELFQRAEKLFHAPTHLLFIARSLAKLGRLVEARETYMKLQRERLDASAPEAFRRAQEAGKGELEALEPRLASVTVTVQAPGGSAKDVRVLLDGKPVNSALVGVPMPVDPGRHTFQARSAGLSSGERTVELEEGGEESLELTLRPSDQAPAGSDGAGSGGAPPEAGASGGMDLRLPGYITLGAGVVGAGLGVTFLVLGSGASSDADDLFGQCFDASGFSQSGCSLGSRAEAISEIESKDDSAALFTGLGVGGLVVGGLGIAAGLTMVLVSDPGPSNAASASWMPVVGPGYVGVTGRF